MSTTATEPTRAASPVPDFWVSGVGQQPPRSAPPPPAPANPAPAPVGPSAERVRVPPAWTRPATGAAGWALIGGVVLLWLRGGALTEVGTVAGFLTSFGRLTGLIASALLLMQVILMARVPTIERAWGQDELVRTHRLVGFTSVNLMLAHIVLITLGHAAATEAGIWGTFVEFALDYPGMLLAIAGTLALCLVVATSIAKARARLRYESWHLIHLYAYLGAGLALPHQLWTGQAFVTSTAATLLWWGLWGAALVAVLVFRLAVPLWRSRRGDLRVTHVRSEGEGVTTVVVGGRNLDRLGAQGGQFFNWRFRDGAGWSRANPYSLSAAPTPDSLRITVKSQGDGSSRLADLKVGTRVLIEGPYGRLHAGVRTREKVVLIGAGIGITPLRALLESLPAQASQVTVIHRVTSRDELILGHEIDAVTRARGGRYLVVEGKRIEGRESWLPARAAHLNDADGLRHLLPDVAESDVFICGAGPWMAAVAAACREAGVPDDAIHLEYFGY